MSDSLTNTVVKKIMYTIFSIVRILTPREDTHPTLLYIECIGMFYCYIEDNLKGGGTLYTETRIMFETLYNSRAEGEGIIQG